jgi:hypothetical protein
MLKRTFDSARKSLNITNSKSLYGSLFNKFSLNNSKKGFATVNFDGLKNILKSEINHEETNYSPVDQNELKTFFQNTKFQFVDKEDSLSLELKKTHGNFEVLVNFQAKPPIPQEEQNQQEGEEKSKYFL